MTTPLHRIPGSQPPSAVQARVQAPEALATAAARTVGEVLAQSQVEAVIAEPDRDLIGLAPVLARPPSQGQGPWRAAGRRRDSRHTPGAGLAACAV